MQSFHQGVCALLQLETFFMLQLQCFVIKELLKYHSLKMALKVARLQQAFDVGSHKRTKLIDCRPDEIYQFNKNKPEQFWSW